MGTTVAEVGDDFMNEVEDQDRTLKEKQIYEARQKVSVIFNLPTHELERVKEAIDNVLEVRKTTDSTPPDIHVGDDPFVSVDDWMMDRAVRTGKFPEEGDTIYASWFFWLHSLSAMWYYEFQKQIAPYELYCKFKKDGKYYRVTGCSRMGDVWLTDDFTQSSGYKLRVCVLECTGWTKVRPLAVGNVGNS